MNWPPAKKQPGQNDKLKTSEGDQRQGIELSKLAAVREDTASSVTPSKPEEGLN